MLKPIHRVACSPALVACQRLMQRFALWLCDPATTGAHINQLGLQPPVLASPIEANWLWDFLQRVDSGRSLLSRAQTVAAMPLEQKAALATWIQTVSALAAQFHPAPNQWPINRPVASELDWKAFKALMEAFYEKAFRSGLPYLSNGTPTAAGGANYADYVSAFRNEHRLSPAPNAREVCVLCGGPLGDTPHVDHWINKSAFPLLSVCADNLQLICSTCNEAPNKGDKPVHSNGSFVDWFHPYLRPGNAALQLDYVLPELSVRCSAKTPADQSKAGNLDALLNLANRWTREFKAEYAKHQDVLIRREQRRIKTTQSRHTPAEILSYVQQWQADLAASEPHHEVHQALATALQEPSRLAAWHRELNLA
ncbi:HNH endonuclease [Pseudomonas aeruginosa]|uniref:HNH endonuclease signature motif containing protein n=1 Tax=Pseudomonas aeruginosa TaxID=287 RepID=UPI000FD5B4A2|nr:HNH endonuclease [Pseudomonas aeruginosa]MCD2825852.1 HNH endonuclease [Pseudomonas aeruginosa]MCD2831882.1 HNH endonuclease [Pseudomonas aeruginosa]RUI10968.1 HNH endonuclease [Pseudomonas aeruginosa]HCF4145012.1 HNH endonuclease [Pseudomonas aeruginosa]